MFRRAWRTRMTPPELRRGTVFFLLYLFLLPYCNAWAQRVFFGDAETPVAEANVIYYALLFAACLLLFRDFLKADFQELLDRLSENAFRVLAGLLGAGGAAWLLRRLPFPVADPIPEQYAQEFSAAPVPTLVLILLLIPLVEETLFRGWLFGRFREYSRVLAYGLSVLLCALAAVWRYALERGDPRYLLLAAAYLPMSLACAWSYDSGGSVWAAAALHGALNGWNLMLAL